MTSDSSRFDNQTPVTVGILAHVDAGKTTLAEQLLYTCGSIRKLGRVDHGDAYLDTHDLERSRGITIFSSQAELSYKDLSLTLLDTPGHTDFSAEMERTLQVLDYAILVISGSDGVQGHTMTLWKLLKRYEVPVFLFINKMDQSGTDREALMTSLQSRLDEHCIDFDGTDEWKESVSLVNETLLDTYLETGELDQELIADLIADRELFPCFFGSALKNEGIEDLLEGLRTYMIRPEYADAFGARVYKISRDPQGNRLTHMKITGGSLKVKDLIGEEKVDQIRIYNGSSFTAVPAVSAGSICTVTGLTASKVGSCYGADAELYGWDAPELEPVLTYEILLPDGINRTDMLQKLRQLEEEDPQLKLVVQESTGRINIQVMGEIQLEILQGVIRDRWNTEVSFGTGSIVYKETISGTFEGVGHYEPLRHYAEVHVLIEPLPAGSGIELATAVSEDVLDRNWQRLIFTHLIERKHPGVLTGSELTDVRFTLLTGKAHLKHTEGGDFRQSTYRAVRQGLMQAAVMGHCVLLEPMYAFRLELPADCLGRAMNDIQMRCGTCETQMNETGIATLTGRVPVSTFLNYQREVLAYTHGTGSLTCTPDGYAPCHNTNEVLEEFYYDPEADTANPPGSVFCSHGAGFYVPWYEVPSYAHLPMLADQLPKEEEPEEFLSWDERADLYHEHQVSMNELEEIFNRTYHNNKGPHKRPGYSRSYGKKPKFTSRTRDFDYQGLHKPRKKEVRKEYLLVDGYNIIHAWDELRLLMDADMGAARGRLMDILSGYQGYRQMTLILVFDAYKVPGGTGSVEKYHNIHVVYTREAETADQYIEKTVHEIGRTHNVTVATSDGLEQMIIMGANGRRMSARDLLADVRLAHSEAMGHADTYRESLHNTVLQAHDLK